MTHSHGNIGSLKISLSSVGNPHFKGNLFSFPLPLPLDPTFGPFSLHPRPDELFLESVL